MSSVEFQPTSSERDNFGDRLRALGKKIDDLLPKNVEVGFPNRDELDDEGGRITISRTTPNTPRGFRYEVSYAASSDQDGGNQRVIYSYHCALPENPSFQKTTVIDHNTGQEIVKKKFEEENVQHMENLISVVELRQSSG